MDLERNLYNELIDKIRSYHPSKDFPLIEKAFELAYEAHKTQFRKSGEPYIIHPLKVAYILAELELDVESIVAGILHDIIEDTEYTYDDLASLFSVEVAELVDGVTKLGKLSYSISKEEMQAENYRKMFLAMAKDIRVILIKLSDRLHNMRTLNFMIPRKQVEIAQETLDIYAPLANRLGISKIKTELEDLCFKYLNPDAYYDLADKIEKKQVEREAYVNQIVEELKLNIENSSIKASIDGRSKHFFSIYKKMVNQNKDLDQIYDLFAVRVLVNSVADCYAVLGLTHEKYVPMPLRFKDYIAMPKPNMYQSLHNTLIGPLGEPFEVQIRTYDMHKTSEYGIAAHWKYKEGDSGFSKNKEEEKLSWLKEILEWQKDMSDNREFMQTLKLDLNIYNDQVYVFTPQGKVVNLLKDSTPIDFAYSIHSQIGNAMVGAKVNNRIVTFDYKIQNGDRVEIITNKASKGPSRDWLKIAKTSQARNKISQWFKSEFKFENVAKGKNLLEKDAKKKGFNIYDLLKSDWLLLILDKYGFKNWEAICAAVGHGGLKEGQIINRLIEEFERENVKNNPNLNNIEDIKFKQHSNISKGSKSGIVVVGAHDVGVRFSKCCNPVPGDEIIGFTTKGRGISVHRLDCVNVLNISDENKQRLIETSWDSSLNEKEMFFLAEINISANEKINLILDVSKILSDENLYVKSFNGKVTKEMISVFNVIFEINSKAKLDNICNKINSIQGVIEVKRVKG